MNKINKINKINAATIISLNNLKYVNNDIIYNIINNIKILEKPYNNWNKFINLCILNIYYYKYLDFIHNFIHNFGHNCIDLHYKFPNYNFNSIGVYMHIIGSKLIIYIISKKLSAIYFNVTL